MSTTKRTKAAATVARNGSWCVVLGLVALLALCASSAQASPLAWSAPQVIDPPQLFSSADIIGVSCPSTSLCVAIDENSTEGHILHSTDPAGSGAPWTAAAMGKFDYPQAVSCPSPAFCAVADNRGNVLITSEPTGGIGAWVPVPLDTEAVEHETSFGFLDVSCPSASFCAAIDDIGNVFTSTDPAGGADAWTETELGDADLEAIACQSSALCVITDFHGNVLTSSEPTGGTSAWHSANISVSGLGGVSCPSASLCMIGGFFGEIFTSSEPTSGSGTWSGVNADGSGYLLDVSCPSVSFCAAVDSFGRNVVTSTNPTGSASAWSALHFTEPEALLAVSCASASFCVAGGTGGTALVGTAEEETKGGEKEEPGSGDGPGSPPAGGSSSPNPMPALVAGTRSPAKKLKCRKHFKKQRVHGKVRCMKVKKVSARH